MTLDNTPILKGLEVYKNEMVKRYHMPGHFGISSYEPMNMLKEFLFDYDVTEVEGTDNLNSPSGMIKEALDKLSQAYNSEKSFFLVNGSTAGIFSMVEATTNCGDKIIVGRNCHKSIFNIAKIKNLKLEFVYPEIDKETGIDTGFSFECVKKSVDSNLDAKALLLTYPNYWGKCYDIQKISDYVHGKGMLLLVDEAHGAHLNFGKKLPKSSLEIGGDIVVQSAHKMLPSLTQTAILHCRKNLESRIVDDVNEAVNMFNSSSPSYLFMASIDISRSYMQEYGEVLLDELSENISFIRQKYSDNKSIKIITSEDYCKLIIRTNYDANQIDESLRTIYKVQAEMVLGKNLLFILGVNRSLEDVMYIIDSVISLSENMNISEESCLNDFYFPTLKKAMEVYEIDKSNLVKVSIEKAIGKIAGEKIIPFPPGIPLVLEGEIISEEVVEIIKSIKLSDEVLVYE